MVWWCTVYISVSWDLSLGNIDLPCWLWAARLPGQPGPVVWAGAVFFWAVSTDLSQRGGEAVMGCNYSSVLIISLFPQ